MSYYQRIATVLVRFACVLAFLLGILGFLYGAVLGAQGAQLTPDQAERFASSFWYVVLGLALFRQSSLGPVPRSRARVRYYELRRSAGPNPPLEPMNEYGILPSNP